MTWTFQETGNTFLDKSVQELLDHTTSLLSVANGVVQLEDAQQVILSAPKSVEELSRGSWQATSFCYQSIIQGEAKQKEPKEQREWEQAVHYWTQQFPSLPSEVRSNLIHTAIETARFADQD